MFAANQSVVIASTGQRGWIYSLTKDGLSANVIINGTTHSVIVALADLKED